jgi:ribonuclease E
MASREEPQVDDTRGLPDRPAPQETLFEDESTEEEAVEQAAPAAERNGEAPNARTAEPVSPARPRGVGSFAGGPPPVSSPPPTMPLFTQPEPPRADAASRFRVTTVESTAAFRPAGPPPVRPAATEPPAEAPAPDAEASSEPADATEAAEPTSEAVEAAESAEAAAVQSASGATDTGSETAEAAEPEAETPAPKPKRTRASRSRAKARADAPTEAIPPIAASTAEMPEAETPTILLSAVEAITVEATPIPAEALEAEVEETAEAPRATDAEAEEAEETAEAPRATEAEPGVTGPEPGVIEPEPSVAEPEPGVAEPGREPEAAAEGPAAAASEPAETPPGSSEPADGAPAAAAETIPVGYGPVAAAETKDAAEAAEEPTVAEAGVRETHTAEPPTRAAGTRSRRRRGRSSRTAAPSEGEPAAQAEAAGGGEPSGQAEATRSTMTPDPLVAGTAQPLGAREAAEATRAATGTGAEEQAIEGGDDTADTAEGPAGSARTRARRRRRAAAKARLRGVPLGETEALDTPEAEDADAATRAGGTATAVAPSDSGEATADTATAPGGPTRTDRSAPVQGDRQGRERGGRQRAAASAAPADTETDAELPTPARGRGRGRRRGNGSRGQGEAAAPAAAAAVAEPAARTSAPERSTRLEANRTRGVRQGADRGRRRRRGGLTEDQKRILREGPERRMLVTEGAERTQIGVIEGRALVEHYVTRKSGRSLVGNIYLGRVQNVLPGMEAAFVDVGKGRNAVLYAGEVNYNEEDLDGEAPRIERALKPGQAILVQVTKDPIGAKGARLTTQVSLAGRYLVLQPEDSTFGISRRLPEAERIRLREILKEVRPKGLGLIVRTAAEGATADDLRADLARLQARWETIERKAKKASPPAVIYQEPELVVRVIRDIFSPDFVELVVDAPGLYERVKAYLEEVAPDLLPKVHAHDGKLPLFEQYRVTEQIHKALERKVWLPSGGSLVIDQTEAMTVVDVNTGKYVGKSNLEETVVATNLEAAEEIVRQLRLRDIGGIIIIDFIDMLFEKNQQAVVERLRSALARDKTKSQVMEVSSLGLVQMTRKRVSGGLLDNFSETCPACEGRGVVITHEV